MSLTPYELRAAINKNLAIAYDNDTPPILAEQARRHAEQLHAELAAVEPLEPEELGELGEPIELVEPGEGES